MTNNYSTLLVSGSAGNNWELKNRADYSFEWKAFSPDTEQRVRMAARSPGMPADSRGRLQVLLKEYDLAQNELQAIAGKIDGLNPQEWRLLGKDAMVSKLGKCNPLTVPDSIKKTLRATCHRSSNAMSAIANTLNLGLASPETEKIQTELMGFAFEGEILIALSHIIGGSIRLDSHQIRGIAAASQNPNSYAALRKAADEAAHSIDNYIKKKVGKIGRVSNVKASSKLGDLSLHITKDINGAVSDTQVIIECKWQSGVISVPAGDGAAVISSKGTPVRWGSIADDSLFPGTSFRDFLKAKMLWDHLVVDEQWVGKIGGEFPNFLQSTVGGSGRAIYNYLLQKGDVPNKGATKTNKIPRKPKTTIKSGEKFIVHAFSGSDNGRPVTSVTVTDLLDVSKGKFTNKSAAPRSISFKAIDAENEMTFKMASAIKGSTGRVLYQIGSSQGETLMGIGLNTKGPVGKTSLEYQMYLNHKLLTTAI